MQTYDQLIREAEALTQSGDTIRAMRLFAKAAQLSPERTEPLKHLAILFTEQGDLEGAAGFLEKAVQINANDAFVRINLGIACYELNRIEKAVTHLKAAVLLIHHFVAATRIDSMFDKGPEMEAYLQQAIELEETGEQAVELLQVIADELQPKLVKLPVEDLQEGAQRLAS